MNKKRIEEIIELMERYNLSEINVEDEGTKVHMKRGSYGTPQLVQQVDVPHAAGAPPAPETKKEAKNLIEVKAPMVGTFYRAPSPDAGAYVEIGQVLKEGDVVCIIEAMKLMNEIKSEVKGKVADILVENGQPVEFGQVLFLVEPA